MENRKSQAGFVLGATLLLLVVVTLLGVSSVSSITLHEKMSSNIRESDKAFEAGLAATEFAESWLESQLNQPIAAKSMSGSAAPPVWVGGKLASFYDPTTWSSADKPARSLVLSNSAGVVKNPEFFTEEWSSRYLGSSLNPTSQKKLTDPRVWYFRNTTKAYGGNDSAVSLVQSIYAKLW